MEVVVVPEELELLDESSSFAQEMRVRLKNVDRKMKIIFPIIQLITKVIYYCLFFSWVQNSTIWQILSNKLNLPEGCLTVKN